MYWLTTRESVPRSTFPAKQGFTCEGRQGKVSSESVWVLDAKMTFLKDS